MINHDKSWSVDSFQLLVGMLYLWLEESFKQPTCKLLSWSQVETFFSYLFLGLDIAVLNETAELLLLQTSIHFRAYNSFLVLSMNVGFSIHDIAAKFVSSGTLKRGAPWLADICRGSYHFWLVLYVYPQAHSDFHHEGMVKTWWRQPPDWSTPIAVTSWSGGITIHSDNLP